MPNPQPKQIEDNLKEWEKEFDAIFRKDRSSELGHPLLNWKANIERCIEESKSFISNLLDRQSDKILTAHEKTIDKQVEMREKAIAQARTQTIDEIIGIVEEIKKKGDRAVEGNCEVQYGYSRALSDLINQLNSLKE